ncbi:Rab geranylgeranyltransferase alpha subunit [Striga asiatica]|uniref:Rab geranylgeranyltransferase alpha subunit n=1 Tax=Striga asiatica TaxID=4170 RepID=A0A5A7QEX8_STRAF|nr:Rab geranylgeranyltransferase alpha subunit [Striga asiatica]
MAMLMMGLTVQCVLDFMVAGISLMIGLGLFAFIASLLCSAAFYQNFQDDGDIWEISLKNSFRFQNSNKVVGFELQTLFFFLTIIYLFIFPLPGINHPLYPIRVGHEPEWAVKPEHSGLRIERDVGNPLIQELRQQPLHDGLPEADPLVAGVHHHVPYDGVEHPVSGRPRERHRPPRLLVLHPQHRVGVVQGQPDLLRVAPGEPDGGEDGVEVVQVEILGAAVECEAAGGEGIVGDRVGGGGGGAAAGGAPEGRRGNRDAIWQ